MKKNNDGFTIVELIVVIAMLVIFIGAVSVNVGRITGYDAKAQIKYSCILHVVEICFNVPDEPLASLFQIKGYTFIYHYIFQLLFSPSEHT